MGRETLLASLSYLAGRKAGVLTLDDAARAGASGKVMAALVRAGTYRAPTLGCSYWRAFHPTMPPRSGPPWALSVLALWRLTGRPPGSSGW